MNDKRIHKLDPLKRRRDLFVVEGDRTRRWRSSRGAAWRERPREALELARREGIQAKLLVPKLLFPVAEEIYADFFRGVQAGLVVEQSHQGQLYRILRMYVNVPAGVQPLARSGSNPILPTSIVERLQQDRPRPAAAAGGRGGAGGLAGRRRERAHEHHHAPRRGVSRRRTTRATSSPSGARAAGTSASSRRSTGPWRTSGGRPTRSRSSRASGARAASPATRRPTASTASTAGRCRSRRGSSSRTPTSSSSWPGATATASRSAAATWPTPSGATWT